MLTTTVSDFRKDIKSYIDKVVDNFETLIINRSKDSAVVIISLDEYNSLMETNYLMSSRANERRLDEAIESINQGKGFKKDLIEE